MEFVDPERFLLLSVIIRRFFADQEWCNPERLRVIRGGEVFLDFRPVLVGLSITKKLLSV
jgi:hypothetical protein